MTHPLNKAYNGFREHNPTLTMQKGEKIEDGCWLIGHSVDSQGMIVGGVSWNNLLCQIRSKFNLIKELRWLLSLFYFHFVFVA